MNRPAASEYDAYFERYVSLVPEGDVIETLAGQMAETLALLDAVPPERETWAYAPGKWSLRQVVGHLADSERVFTGRALWIARAPRVPQPGMDQDLWVENSPAGKRPMSDLLAEWKAVRAATLALARGLDEPSLTRAGTASGWPVTVRALLWVTAGHELHHRAVLREQYALEIPLTAAKKGL